MSGGYNKAFLAAMRGNATQIPYLRRNVLASQPHIHGSDSGIKRVNLRASRSGIEVAIAPQNRSTFSNAFLAYWLPNNEKAAPTITLGTDGADIFLTPALTGCVLEINGNVITHHDAYSKTCDEAKGLTLGGRSGRRHWYNEGIGPDFFASVVVGVRIQGAWKFYQQSYTISQADLAVLPANQVTEI